MGAALMQREIHAEADRPEELIFTLSTGKLKPGKPDQAEPGKYQVAMAVLARFHTAFLDSKNREVAGTMFVSDLEPGWIISSVPVQRFRTEAAAIKFYRRHCDQETGILAFPPVKRRHL